MKLIKEKKYRFEVPEGKKKERIDTFLTNSIENATRSKVQKSIEAKLVKVNGKVVKANYKIKPHDIIEAIQPITPRPEDVEPENIPLDIVYEDDAGTIKFDGGSDWYKLEDNDKIEINSTGDVTDTGVC